MTIAPEGDVADGRMHVSGLLMGGIMSWEPWIRFDEVMLSGLPVIYDSPLLDPFFLDFFR